jgi:hypothetical protein
VGAVGALAWRFFPRRHPTPDQPIPVRFRLAESAYVTLVVERAAAAAAQDGQGVRVRNLISNTWYPAGEHTVWWDGLDEANTRLISIPSVAVYYQILGAPVPAGEYRVRLLTRQAVAPKYQFAVYSGDQSPPWDRDAKSGRGLGRGGWLADHTPPAAALFLPSGNGTAPRVLLASPVGEAGNGLVWTDLDGRRVDSTHGIGAGHEFGGAELLARDVGSQPAPTKDEAYLAGAWFQTAEVWGIGSSQQLFTHAFARAEDAAVGGLAVRDGRIALSLPKVNQVVLLDAAKGAVLGQAEVQQPRGLAFDAAGRLLVLSGHTLTAWNEVPTASGLGLELADWRSPAAFEDPQGIALDEGGQIYVSDWGERHQVDVLSPDGQLIRTIGHPGTPQVGPYDPWHMQYPRGLTVTSDGRLWVAEQSFVPKRVSIWTLDGQFVKAMYGPTWYGGGGALDPRDRTRFFTHGGGGGMEFRLDWDRGTAELQQIYYLPGQTGMTPPSGNGKALPQTPVWVGERLYLSNAFATGPTNGEDIVSLWLYRDGIAVPVACFGDTAGWPLLATEAYRARWPTGVPPQSGGKRGVATFVWSDLGDDGQVEPDEVQIIAGPPGWVTLDGELGLTTSWAVRYAPVGFTPQGAPLYDLARGQQLAAAGPENAGGGQVIAARAGWTVFTWPPEPLAPAYLAGAKDGQLHWTYPDEYLGLDSSHQSSPPRQPGEIIGTTRLLGFSVLAGIPTVPPIELWAINGNYGTVYLFTTDGLLVATLFQDARVAKPWPADEQRGAQMQEMSLGQECFFPSIQQLPDGQVYLIGGQPFAAIFEITGLDTLRRWSDQRLTVTAEQVAAARRYRDTHGQAHYHPDATPTPNPKGQ